MSLGCRLLVPLGLFALGLPCAAQELDLFANMPSGTHSSMDEIVATCGEPLVWNRFARPNQQDVSASDTINYMYYDGFTIWAWQILGRSDWVFVTVELYSPRLKLRNGLSVGATCEDVRAVMGQETKDQAGSLIYHPRGLNYRYYFYYNADKQVVRIVRGFFLD